MASEDNNKKHNFASVIYKILGVELLVVFLTGAFFAGKYVVIPYIQEKMQAAPNQEITIPVTSTDSSQKFLSDIKGTDAATEAAPVEKTLEEETTVSGEEKADEIEPAESNRVSLVAVGDNLMHYTSSMSGLQKDGTYSYYQNFCHVSDKFHVADLAVINQEAVMGGAELGLTDGMSFNAPLEVGDSMAAAGINVVLAANNHTFDRTKTAVETMKEFWRDMYPDVTLLGLNDSEEERETVPIVNVNGIKIAMINYTYGSNNILDLDAEPFLMNVYDSDWLTRIVTKAKEEADFVIVFPHWGTEDTHEIDDSQREETHLMAQLGVDLVIGSHPHVVQPVKWVERPDGGQMLVYYSLGNFQSIQDKTDNMLGGMAAVTIVKEDGIAKIDRYDLDFVVTHYQNNGEEKGYFEIVTTYMWDDYTADLASVHGILHWDDTFSYDRLDIIRQQVINTCELGVIEND